ncbi:MAG: nucleoside triphosphate pyrophosphatase [Hyphomicrobiaceae bacterium]
MADARNVDQPPSVVLASTSVARRAMLSAAGLTFDVVPARIDEDAVRSAMVAVDAYVSPAMIAARLAQEKALAVARANAGKLVIGSDQVLVFENTIFSKVATLDEARAVLKKLRGRVHELVSAVALARDGELVWHHEEAARLTMRDFSDAFLAGYLEDAGEVILQCVGCYELEAKGVQLFEKIEGDYFTVLGLPLLALLSALRTQGALIA